MKLSPEEREDFKQDGLDPQRRDSLDALRNLPQHDMSFDAYLDFLAGLQALFPFSSAAEKPFYITIARL